MAAVKCYLCTAQGLKPIKATMTTTRPPAAAAGSEPVTIWKVAVSLVTVDKIPDLLPPKPPLTIACARCPLHWLNQVNMMR